MGDRNLASLDGYARRDIPVVGLEPSCLLVLRDEYLDLFPNDPRARRVASVTRLMEEFMTEAREGGRVVDRLRLSRGGSPILLHGHCHAKSLIGSGPTLELLRVLGRPVEEIDSGCCGMAGSFGYEAEHYSLSMEIGELKLFPAVRAGAKRGAEFAAAGFSCRSQIEDATGVKARHPIEFLAEALVRTG